MGSDQDSHRAWLAYALEESLRRSVYSAKDILVHASPEVLVAQLPHQVISEILSRALTTGTFSPATIIETAPPALLAEYLSPELVWRCLKEAAERAGVTKKGATRSAAARQWLCGLLQRALDGGLVTPADVLRFLPPGEFVGAAPLAVVAELIKNGLTRGSFDPALVLQHLTPSVIAENLESSLVWACLAESVARAFELDATQITPAPLLDRTPAPGAPRKAASGSTSGRVDTNVPRPPVVPSKPVLPSEWKAVDDLDLLEEETVPSSRLRP